MELDAADPLVTLNDGSVMVRYSSLRYFIALFLHGFRGTGKTFIWNALTASIRSKRGIILNVASNGNAATLLPSVRTAHSRNIDQASRLCNGTRLQVTQLGKNIIKAKALNGTSAGQDILIHKMDMNTCESKLPFKMTKAISNNHFICDNN
ncbi:hypothetical protein K1719_037913 [Acacia pycnantha]|nr:hypothetical protein K1719_037913 [Acacia pycnantha]